MEQTETGAGQENENGRADIADELQRDIKVQRNARAAENKYIKKGMVSHHTQNTHAADRVEQMISCFRFFAEILVHFLPFRRF